MTQKVKNILNWSLTGLVGFIFIGSALSKFFGGDETVQMAQGIGLDISTFKIIGVVELISITLFIIPRTGILGTLLLAAYMGGAMAAHVTHGQSILAPALIQAFIWIVAVIRFPELKGRILQDQ
jgi:hypothetical protein